MSIDKLEPFSGDAYQYRLDLFKYLINEKKPVYGWQGDYIWYAHINRNWLGVIERVLQERVMTLDHPYLPNQC